MLPELDEKELRVATEAMYRDGGAQRVLDCVMALQKVQGVVLSELRQLTDLTSRDFFGQ